MTDLPEPALIAERDLATDLGRFFDEGVFIFRHAADIVVLIRSIHQGELPLQCTISRLIWLSWTEVPVIRS